MCVMCLWMSTKLLAIPHTIVTNVVLCMCDSSQDDNQQKNFNPAQQVSNEAIEGIEPASFPHDIEYDPNFVYCKICYKEQVNTLFLPCLHVRTCTDCTDKILCRQQGQCPFCRKIITKTMLIYT